MAIQMRIGIKQGWILLLLVFGWTACHDEDLSECEAMIHDYDLYENGPEDAGTKILNYDIADDCLELVVQYGGGCQDHDIDLVVGTWLYSLPPVAEAKLVHENTDPCDALVTETLYFETESLFSGGSSRVKLAIKGFDEIIEIDNTD
jgi:hypothetical protein